MSIALTRSEIDAAVLRAAALPTQNETLVSASRRGDELAMQVLFAASHPGLSLASTGSSATRPWRRTS